MGKFAISAAAQKQGVILPAGYYPCQISHCEEKESSKKDSMNTFVYFNVTEGKYAGTNLSVLFNSKGLDAEKGAPGAVIALEFLKSLGVDVKEDQDIEVNTEGFNGMQLDVYTQPGSFNGKSRNDVTGFRPFKNGQK